MTAPDFSLVAAAMGLSSPLEDRLADEHRMVRLMADDLGIHEAAAELARTSGYSYPYVVNSLAMLYGPGWDETAAKINAAYANPRMAPMAD